LALAATKCRFAIALRVVPVIAGWLDPPEGDEAKLWRDALRRARTDEGP